MWTLQVTTHVGNLNNPLPEEWTNKFDFVWSCEVFCHAGDKKALLKEVRPTLDSHTTSNGVGIPS